MACFGSFFRGSKFLACPALCLLSEGTPVVCPLSCFGTQWMVLPSWLFRYRDVTTIRGPSLFREDLGTPKTGCRPRCEQFATFHNQHNISHKDHVTFLFAYIFWASLSSPNATMCTDVTFCVETFEPHHRVLQGVPLRGRQLTSLFQVLQTPLLKASKAPFLTLRVAAPSGAPCQATA